MSMIPLLETDSFNKLSAKFGLDSQIVVDIYKSFDSHINVPKDKWTKHYEPFKDICKENEIFTNDCNRLDPISKNNVLYKHVNFCGVHRPCESTRVEEDKYCKQHISMKELANGLRIYINLLEN